MHERSDEPMTATTRADPAPTARRHRALIDAIRSELAQLGTLLDDATAKMISSFEAMAGDRTVATSTGRERSADAAARMDPAMADVVTALQFHDIASQLLASIAAHVERLDGVSATHACRAARRQDDGPVDRPPAPRTSVTQTTMAVGTVELF